MASAQQQHQVHSYAGHPPPANHYEVRLPPIRELGVVYRDEQAPSLPPNQTDYAVQGHLSRHEPQVWSRSSSGPGPTSSQHGSMPPPSDPSKSQYSNKPDGQYATPGLPLSAQGSVGNTSSGSRPGSGRGDPPSQPALKRARSNSSVGEAPGRSPHTAYQPHAAYSSHPPPPGSFHSHQQGAPPSQDTVHPPVFSQPATAYPTYVQQQHLPQRHYPVPPPAAHSQPSPSPSYPPPTSAEHWQQQQAPPPPPHYQSPAPQGPYNNFPRTTPLVPESVESRNGPLVHDHKRLASRQDTITQIVEHCNILYQFANRCASQSHMQPSPEELHDMSKRATLVVHLMDELRRLSLPEDQLPKELPANNGANEEHRPPKRPWEDTVNENESTPNPANHGEYSDDKIQSTAEQDMEIIRSKRATSAGGNAPGQPKSKYRKRSRATPPGKCHSCNIRETPEWRRGPDGARTLCNACGLHYAKLMRKRDKNGIGPDGKPAITIESLRASTASARGGDQGADPPAQQVLPPHQSGLIPATYDQHVPNRPGPSPPHMGMQYSSPHPPSKAGPPPPHMQHSPHPQHPGYSAMPVQGGHHQMIPPQAHGETVSVPAPPPPWMTTSASATSSGRPTYGEDHQTYMRTSHPPSHARASPQ